MIPVKQRSGTARKFLLDQQSISQLEHLQSFTEHVLCNGEAHSLSTIVRRAIGLYLYRVDELTLLARENPKAAADEVQHERSMLRQASNGSKARWKRYPAIERGQQFPTYNELCEQESARFKDNLQRHLRGETTDAGYRFE